MNRGELIYRELKRAGQVGLNRSQLSIRTGLVDIPKAVEAARRDWCDKNREKIVTKMEVESFLRIFKGKRQARYFYKRIRN